MAHTIQETFELAVKLAVQQVKLDLFPIGKLWLTLGNEDPAKIVGGGWEKINTYVLQCSSDNHKAGETIEAGLPNIWGNGPWMYTYDHVNSDMSDGVFRWSTYGGGVDNNNPSASTGSGNLRFNANWCNPIYGKSNTVQPNTIIINVWQRVS